MVMERRGLISATFKDAKPPKHAVTEGIIRDIRFSSPIPAQRFSVCDILNHVATLVVATLPDARAEVLYLRLAEKPWR